MLQHLQRMWRGEAAAETVDADPHQLAAAALLVTAGTMDDVFDDAERARVRALLETRFALSGEAADALFAEAEDLARTSVDLFGFTSAIKQGFAPEARIDIVEMVWEVVYADGVVHDHEASLMRRIVGLLGVSDRDSGAARVRVRERLGL